LPGERGKQEPEDLPQVRPQGGAARASVGDLNRRLRVEAMYFL
jgi:hypothetical protein